MRIERTILIVDDDEAMRDMLLVQFEEKGWNCAVAAGVREAIAAIEENQFSVIVSDLYLGSESGFELLNGTHADPPVVLMSAFDANGVEEEALTRGAAAFIQKPFRPDDLLRVLEDLV